MGSAKRKKREKAARRRLILESACATLLKKGFTAATIRDIARASELSVGTIYLYFKNKEEIFFTLYNDGMDLLLETVRAAADTEGDCVQRLRRVAFAYKDFARDNKPYFDTISYFLTFPEIMFPEEKRAALALKGNAALEVIRDLFEQGIQAAEFKDVNPSDFSFFLWTSLHSLLQFKKMQELLFDSEEFDRMFAFNLEHLLSAFVRMANKGGQPTAL